MGKIVLQGIEPINDPCYRYTMEAPVIKSESGKIIFKNIDDVADSIRRDPKLIASYITYRCGCQTDYNSNSGKNQLVISSKGQLDINDLIREFISYVVLCGGCANPETYIDGDNPQWRCSSCGYMTIANIKNKFLVKLFKIGKKEKKKKKDKKDKKDKEEKINKKSTSF